MPDPDPDVWTYLWTSSPESDKVIPAFVAALNDMHDIKTDSKVEAGPMRYKYATLGAVLDEVKPKLSGKGLAMSQSPTALGVITTIFHDSGQWLRFPPVLIESVGKTPQNVGSAISYSRRYSVLSICNLATEDDDGASASVNPRSEAPAHDPVKIRTDAVMRRLGELTADQQNEVKAWADGRSLAGNNLFRDVEWLSQVEGYLAVLDDDIAREAAQEAATTGDPSE